jgi:hypothetical protein
MDGRRRRKMKFYHGSNIDTTESIPKMATSAKVGLPTAARYEELGQLLKWVEKENGFPY